MAARTMTYTLNMSGPLRANHVGVNALSFNFNSGTTALGTLSDTVLLGKIPNGSVIVGGELRFGAQGSAASTWTMLLLSDEGAGTFSTLATLTGQDNAGTSMTAGGAAHAYTIYGIGTKVSYSDDRAIKYATLALNCTVGPSETASFSFQGHLLYVTDGRSA
jgi:hypothetical protein